MGLGIDRLCMMLLGQENIRDLNRGKPPRFTLSNRLVRSLISVT